MNNNILDYYQSLGRELLNEYKLSKWKFSYSKRFKNILGLCNYTKKEIILNETFTKSASYDEVLDIIIHEISHALVGYKHKHNDVWKKKFLELGGTGNRLYSFSTNYVPYMYSANCCDTSFGRYVKPKKDLYCSHCSKKLVFKKSK